MLGTFISTVSAAILNILKIVDHEGPQHGEVFVVQLQQLIGLKHRTDRAEVASRGVDAAIHRRIGHWWRGRAERARRRGQLRRTLCRLILYIIKYNMFDHTSTTFNFRDSYIKSKQISHRKLATIYTRHFNFILAMVELNKIKKNLKQFVVQFKNNSTKIYFLF